MSEPIDYPRLVQDALRQVVCQVLTIAADSAPGSFHFYVGFNTRAPGVELPAYLRDLFPEEMRIVLQHQFWDLEVDDDGFSVVLSFNAARHRLSVPFTALTAFYDAEQDFALRFALPEGETAPAAGTPTAVTTPAAGDPPAEPASDRPEGNPPAADRPAGKTGKVVSLDAFRKK